MSQQTYCPACGAPLEFSGNEDTVHCSFCGAGLHIIQQDDQTSIQVVSQPLPQKEVLSNPVVASTEPTGSADESAGEEPVVGWGDVPQSTFPSSGDTVTPAPPAYTTGTPVAPVRSNTQRWVLITLAAVAGVCVTCACLSGIVLAVFRSR